MAPDPQQRIALFRQRLSDDPRSGVFVPLAELLAVSGDVDEAVGVLEEGLARNPGSVPGRVVLGRVLLTAGRSARGREVLGEVLAADPQNLVARRLLADDCRGRGDWDAAVGHLAGLVADDPGNERWEKELAEARGQAAGRAAAQPPAGFATMTMVDICIAQGKHERAAEALRGILAVQPDREDARRRLAQVEAALAEAGQGGGADPEGGAGEGPMHERRRRREAQKAQFAEWIDRIRQDGEGK
jgi:predicted Zn-dependent protease